MCTYDLVSDCCMDLTVLPSTNEIMCVLALALVFEYVHVWVHACLCVQSTKFCVCVRMCVCMHVSFSCSLACSASMVYICASFRSRVQCSPSYVIESEIEQ